MIFDREESMEYWTHCCSLGHMYYTRDEVDKLIEKKVNKGDKDFSLTSENPVQNKVITKAINDLNARIDGAFHAEGYTLYLSNQK